jgi:hypothetical protein
LSLTQQDFDLNEEALELAWPIATSTTVNAPDYHTQPRDAFVKHVSCGPIFCAVPGRTAGQACFWGSNLFDRCGD